MSVTREGPRTATTGERLRGVAASADAAGFVFLTLVHLAFSLTFPLGLQYMLDHAAEGAHTLWMPTTLLGLGFVLATLAFGFKDRVIARRVSSIVGRLRRDMHEMIVRARADQRLDSASLTGGFGNDLYTLETGLYQFLARGFDGVLLAVGSTLLLFWIDWRLALLVLVLMPIVYLGPERFSGHASRYAKRRKAQEDSLLARLRESLDGRPVISSFQLSEAIHRPFVDASGELDESSSGAFFWSSFIGRLVSMSVYFITLVVLGAGAFMVSESLLSVGALVAFLAMLINVGDAIDQVSNALPAVYQGRAGAERIDQLIAELVEVQPSNDGSDPVEVEQFRESLSLRGVAFSHTQAERTLDDLDLVINFGESVAVVGPSGSGKSTLLGILMGLHTPDEGTITLDGKALAGGGLEALGPQVSVVHQTPFLFDTTIRENIRLGLPSANDADVEEAARAAGVDQMVAELADAYDTQVGPGGTRLSGGQRQRVALARALVRRPRLLILDEFTSALDVEAETAIHQTLSELRGTITLVQVTHRLAHLPDVDRVVVLDGGRVVEDGSHAELLGRRGIYARMWRKASGIRLSGGGRRAHVEPERLAEIPLFEHFDRDALEELSRYCFTERFAPGETLIERGSMGRRFFLIARGAVEVVDEAGPESPVVATRGTGDFIGEISLIRNIPSIATVRCKSSTTCVVLEREDFERLLSDHPDLRAEVESIAAQRTSPAE